MDRARHDADPKYFCWLARPEAFLEFPRVSMARTYLLRGRLQNTQQIRRSPPACRCYRQNSAVRSSPVPIWAPPTGERHIHAGEFVYNITCFNARSNRGGALA
jgi:hypothetical protein